MDEKHNQYPGIVNPVMPAGAVGGHPNIQGPGSNPYPQHSLVVQNMGPGTTGSPVNGQTSVVPLSTEQGKQDEAEHDDNVDLANEKDIYKLTPHVEIAFEDTFKESTTARSFPFMTEVNEAIYKYTHFAIYATFSLVFAPIASFLWAIVFALVHISIIWFIQPILKFQFIFFRIFSMTLHASFRVFLDPLFTSISLVFSGIRGRFQMADSEINVALKTVPVQDV